MKNILIIDPFVKQPVNNCFNRLVDLLPVKSFLFQPAFFPMNLYNLPHVDGYIVLGSATHVYEKLPWQLSLSDFLLSELKNNKPVLALCFGHQLLAHAFGAEIDFLYPNQDKVTGHRIMTLDNNEYYIGVSHRQAVSALSKDLIPLIAKNNFGYDLISHATLPFLGCQGHPEASDQFLRNDCNISDYDLRDKIIKSSSNFLLKWIQKYSKIP